MKNSPEIRPADEAEFGQIVRLLEDLALPSSGLRPNMPHLFVAIDNGRMAGCAALEVNGRFGLIRSVAIDPSLQGRGVGRLLVDAVHRRAVEIGLDAVYLLTTTAEDYFPRFGYQRLDGDNLPEVVTASAEFSACSALNAAVMVKSLDPKEAHAA